MWIIRRVTMWSVFNVIWEKFVFVHEMNNQMRLKTNVLVMKTLLPMNNVPHKLQAVFLILYHIFSEVRIIESTIKSGNQNHIFYSYLDGFSIMLYTVWLMIDEIACVVNFFLYFFMILVLIVVVCKESVRMFWNYTKRSVFFKPVAEFCDT